MFSVDSYGVVRIVETRSRPNGWEDITVELLDVICEYLPIRNELLPMRGVSKHWNSVVNSVLERRTLQQWTVWNPFVTVISRISPFPLLDLGLRTLDAPRRADYEYFSSLFQNVDVNPFPNNSLHLRHVPFGPFLKLRYNLDGKVHGFLSSQGIHLTSLKLVILEVAPLEFYRILLQMPNLRALTLTLFGKSTNLNGVVKEMKLLENEELPPSPCPTLAYLRICGWNADDKSVLFPWLLKLFAAQLISLEIVSLEMDKLPLNRSFQKLQRLKIVDPSTMHFLQACSTLRAPLQAISLKVFDMMVPINEFLQFIHNFSDSLVYLYLDISALKDDVEETIKLPLTSKLCPVFPKVNKLAIHPIRKLEVLGHFQLRFTNLSTLQLLDFYFYLENSERRENQEEERIREAAANYCRDVGFWIKFPKLRTIEVYPSSWITLPRNFFVLTRT